MKCASLLMLILTASGGLLLQPAAAQNADDAGQSAIALVQGPLERIMRFLNSSNMLPQFDIENNAGQFQAFIMFAILVWMVLDIFFGAKSLVNFIFTFAISVFFFNRLNALFTPAVVEQIFTLVFSALFVFIFTDFLMGFAWGFSRKTRSLLNLAVTAVAVTVLNFTHIYDQVAAYITTLSWGGFAVFIGFMILMRVFNTFFSMMRMKPAIALRSKGAATTGHKKAEHQKEFAAEMEVKK